MTTPAALRELAEVIATDMENFAEGMYQGGSALFDFADRVRALGATAAARLTAEPVGFRFRVLGEEHRDRPWTGSGIVAEWNKPVPPDNDTIQYQALYTQLRTAASEGGAEPFAHLVMTEWNSIAWWTTESAERAQKEADDLMRYDSKRKLTVVTVYTHPPEVARDVGRNALWCKVASELLPPWQWNRVEDRVSVLQNREEIEAAISGAEGVG